MKEEFLEKVYQHQPIIHKVCRLYRDIKEDRDDLFQEIIYQLWKSYPAFKGNAKFSSWMYRISLNTAMVTFRKPKLNTMNVESFPEQPVLPETEAEDSDEERLFTAIRKLDASERAIVSLYLEDMSYAEIAGIIGISENYVGVRLNRIKHKLKHLL